MFKLIEKTEKNVFRIKIVADTNDGDYSTGVSTVSAEDFMSRGIFELMILRDEYGKRHELEDFRYDPIFRMPDGNDYGDYRWHTLVSFSIEFIHENGVVYDVELSQYDDLTEDEKVGYKYRSSLILGCDDEDDEEFITNRLEEEELRMSIYNS